MILAKPPISVSTDAQRSPNKANQGQKETTQMVRDRDDMTRHPVTKKFTSRYQNQQSDAPAEAEDVRVSEKGSLTGNKY